MVDAPSTPLGADDLAALRCPFNDPSYAGPDVDEMTPCPVCGSLEPGDSKPCVWTSGDEVANLSAENARLAASNASLLAQVEAGAAERERLRHDKIDANTNAVLETLGTDIAVYLWPDRANIEEAVAYVKDKVLTAFCTLALPYINQAQSALSDERAASAAGDARIAELVKELCKLTRGYVSLLESGRNRILDLGGSCDDLDHMEAGDPCLRSARLALHTATGERS